MSSAKRPLRHRQGCLALVLLTLVHGGMAWSSPVAKIDEARVAASAGDHERAIQSYLAAVEEAPSLRDSVAVPLASQYTWAGRYDEAIAEFNRYLELHPDQADAMMTLALAQSWSGRTGEALLTYRAVLRIDPGNRDAALGVARMLSWQGHLDESIRAYSALLKRNPDMTDAALARATVMNWRGDNRRAAALFADLLRLKPASVEALLGKAHGLNWAGRPDRALKEIEDVARIDPGNRDAATLGRAIRGAARPHPGLNIDLSRDSDSFRQLAARLDLEQTVRYRAHLRPSWSRGYYWKEDRPRTEDSWIGFGCDIRLSDPFLAYGNAQLLVERPAGVAADRGAGDAHLGWLPTDRIRVDAGFSRASILTYGLGAQDRIRYVDADLFDLGISVRPFWRTTVSLSGDRAFYDGPAKRATARLRIRHSLTSKPRLWIETGTQWIDFNDAWIPGIWMPQEYRSFVVAPDLDWSLGRGAGLFGRMDAGFSRERGSKATPYMASLAGFRYDHGGLHVELRAGRSDSNLETGRGYRRSFTSMAVRVGL